MISQENIYLFHNIYGDADELLKTKADNVIAIPAGWTEELETARNNMLAELNIGIGQYPAVVFWKKEQFVPKMFVGTEKETKEYYTDAKWDDIPVGDWPQEDWTWDKILFEIAKFS